MMADQPSSNTRFSSPKLGLAALRGRLIFRTVFLLLMLATVLLALIILQGEKLRAYQNYHRNLHKTHATILAKLRHPSGQLALLNPDIFGQPITPLRPLLLPYAALDFSDHNKSQQAIEVAGCAIHYPNGDICIGIGSNPYAGGFVYILGKVETTDLISRVPGVLDLHNVHRLRVTMRYHGEETHWNAPFEQIDDHNFYITKGKLAGFLEETDQLNARARPNKEFRGWIWQYRHCNDEFSHTCQHSTYYSVRLPVKNFAKALLNKKRPVWPPKDLADYHFDVMLMAPLTDQPVFDSNQASVSLPYALSGLAEPLLSGETLSIKRNRPSEKNTLTLSGESVAETPSAYFHALQKLIDWMPIVLKSHQQKQLSDSLVLQDILKHSTGNYAVTLMGHLSSVNRELSMMAERVTWVVAVMLTAILLAWLLVEFSFLRRLTLLTKRAAEVSYRMQTHAADHTETDLTERVEALHLEEFKASDEVGILANTLTELLSRIQQDVQRAKTRAQQDKDMWQAVGHEIMSPLQSLMVLHPDQGSQSHRYVHRMLQAVRMLYGHASPSEAVEAANIDLEVIDANAFMQQIAENAHYAGITDVIFNSGEAEWVRANPFSLEDALTHILNNAQRYRKPNTPIVLKLDTDETTVALQVENIGEQIAQDQLERIFEYGITAQDAAVDEVNQVASEQSEVKPIQAQPSDAHRGQGLFISKSYVTKMGGQIQAKNLRDGVAFIIRLPKAKRQ